MNKNLKIIFAFLCISIFIIGCMAKNEDESGNNEGTEGSEYPSFLKNIITMIGAVSLFISKNQVAIAMAIVSILVLTGISTTILLAITGFYYVAKGWFNSSTSNNSVVYVEKPSNPIYQETRKEKHDYNYDYMNNDYNHNNKDPSFDQSFNNVIFVPVYDYVIYPVYNDLIYPAVTYIY
jgi:hypothetical protein